MAKTGKQRSKPYAERSTKGPARSARQLAHVAPLLTEWYRTAARDLPWRRTRDPYGIWVSEVMLQQTQVATVIPYYQRWMKRFPNVSALARASEHDVLHAWQGLGYYSRARSLLSGAKAVLERHGGRIPDDVDALRALPGVGPYTAGAIASIAHGKPAAIVDGNVTRVLCRVFALDGDPTRAPLKSELWRLAESLVPHDAAAEFNQALMELGATVCTPRSPACLSCPLARQCAARAEGRVAELPASKRRADLVPVHMAAAVVERRGRVLLTRLPDDAPRWAGMWLFPLADVAPRERPARTAERAVRDAAGLTARAGERLLVVHHGVTRYRITLDAFVCTPTSGRARALACQEITWKRPEELSTLALPAAHRRIARALLT